MLIESFIQQINALSSHELNQDFTFFQISLKGVSISFLPLTPNCTVTEGTTPRREHVAVQSFSSPDHEGCRQLYERRQFGFSFSHEKADLSFASGDH
jgi:hypothetical protein